MRRDFDTRKPNRARHKVDFPISSSGRDGGRSPPTPAVLAARNDFYQKYPDVASKIRQAAEDALPATAAEAGAPPDWAKDL